MCPRVLCAVHVTVVRIGVSIKYTYVVCTHIRILRRNALIPFGGRDVICATQ